MWVFFRTVSTKIRAKLHASFQETSVEFIKNKSQTLKIKHKTLSTVLFMLH